MTRDWFSKVRICCLYVLSITTSSPDRALSGTALHVTSPFEEWINRPSQPAVTPASAVHVAPLTICAASEFRKSTTSATLFTSQISIPPQSGTIGEELAGCQHAHRIWLSNLQFRLMRAIPSWLQPSVDSVTAMLVSIWPAATALQRMPLAP